MTDPLNSLSGLPPLPKSLSNANLIDSGGSSSGGSSSKKSSKRHRKGGSEGGEKLPPPPPAPRQPPPPPPPRKQTKLDVQLARLRKEMFALRELDLSLLSQLWSLNEALQEFRAIQEMMSPSSDVDDEPVAAIYSNMPPLPSYPLSSSSSSNNGFTTEL